MRLLLDGRADVSNATTKNGETPLYAAANRGKLMALQCLLDDGAETNIATADVGIPHYMQQQRRASSRSSDA